jgi:hypothetical protein
MQSRDSAVRIARGNALDDSGVGIRALVWSRMCISLYRPDRPCGLPILQTNWRRGIFPRGGGGKGTGTWISPLTYNLCRDQENVGPYIHSPHISSRCSAQLVNRRDNFILWTHNTVWLIYCAHNNQPHLLRPEHIPCKKYKMKVIVMCTWVYFPSAIPFYRYILGLSSALRNVETAPTSSLEWEGQKYAVSKDKEG